MGEVGRSAGAREIEASGRIVAPGFIDAHTHDDRALLSRPDMTPKVSQGVITVVTMLVRGTYAPRHRPAP